MAAAPSRHLHRPCAEIGRPGEQLLIHDLDLEMCSEQKHRMPMAGLRSRMFGQMWAAGMAIMDRAPMPIEW